MGKYWGIELIVNLSSCDKEKITNEKNIKEFIKTLVKKNRYGIMGRAVNSTFCHS